MIHHGQPDVGEGARVSETERQLKGAQQRIFSEAKPTEQVELAAVANLGGQRASAPGRQGWGAPKGVRHLTICLLIFNF